MHGNPNWFGKRGISLTLPTTWRGWFYLTSWAAAMALPALLLHDLQRTPEMCIWLAASGYAFSRDVRRMRQQAAAAAAEPFVIDDDRDITRLRRGRPWWRTA